MTGQSKKVENIQALRGIAVMLVIFFHVACIEKTYGHGQSLMPNFINIGAAGVDIFFVISGFIMASIIGGQFQSLSAASTFAFHRITRIYPLYWFYSAIFLVCLFLSNFTQGNTIPALAHQFDYLRILLLLPHAGPNILIVSWTLFYEIYFYAVIAVLLLLPERWFLKSLVVWGALIVASYFLFASKTPTHIIVTSPMGLEFIAGCFMARMSYIFSKHISWLLFGGGIGLLFLLFYVHPPTDLFIVNHINYDFMRIIRFGIPSMLMVLGVVSLEKNRICLPKFIIQVGNASYSIYLSHFIIYYAIGKIWRKLPYNSASFHLAIYSVMVVTVMVYGLLSYRYIEKPMINFFRNLIQRETISTGIKVES